MTGPPIGAFALVGKGSAGKSPAPIKHLGQGPRVTPGERIARTRDKHASRTWQGTSRDLDRRRSTKGMDDSILDTAYAPFGPGRRGVEEQGENHIALAGESETGSSPRAPHREPSYNPTPLKRKGVRANPGRARWRALGSGRFFVESRPRIGSRGLPRPQLDAPPTEGAHAEIPTRRARRDHCLYWATSRSHDLSGTRSDRPAQARPGVRRRRRRAPCGLGCPGPERRDRLGGSRRSR